MISEPLIAVAQQDASDIESLSLPAKFTVLEAHESGAAFGAVPGARTFAGFVAVSSQGRELMERTRQSWEEAFGETAPELLDLSGGSDATAQRREAALEWLVRQLMQDRVACARRNSTLARDLARLREAHEQTQTAFQRLESYVFSTGKTERTKTFDIAPDAGLSPCALTDGDLAEQRLPCDSVGLSDVAIAVAGSAPQNGSLIAALDVLETGKTVANWSVPGDRIANGWLRLSLDTALGTQACTPILRLEWQGEGTLHLVTALRNPAERFCAHVNSISTDQTLALRGWKYVPDVAAIMPADGHPANEARVARKWVVGRSFFKRAENLAPQPALVSFEQNFGGLAVRPGADGVSAARLKGAYRAGVQQIVGSAETKQEGGPEVEYAIAVAPASRRGQIAAGAVPGTGMQVSDWVRLAPSQWSQLHFFLPEPLEESGDIYLMTRLPGGEAAEAPPNACFFRMTTLC